MPAIGSLPWQSRVRVFSDLALKTLAPSSPGMPLAQSVISVAHGSSALEGQQANDGGGSSALPSARSAAEASMLQLQGPALAASDADTPRHGAWDDEALQLQGEGSGVALAGGLGDGSATATPRLPGRDESGAQEPLQQQGEAGVGAVEDGGERSASPTQGLLRGGAGGSSGGAREDGVLGFTVQARGLTHEVVRAGVSVPQLPLDQIQPGKPGEQPCMPSSSCICSCPLCPLRRP